MYTSLYRVVSLKCRPQSKAAILWKDRCQYVWGAELIHTLALNDKEVAFTELEIDEEITYFQSKCFSKFVTDIVD